MANYVALTKPRIIELLLVTTVPVMFLAHRGVPDLWLVAATVIGGYLSAGAANTFNMVYDRDIDALMHRTEKRPIVTGEVSVRAGMVFGVLLTVVSTVWFAWLVNWPSAVLSVAAIASVCRGLHDAPQAADLAEHRLGWRRRVHAGPHRLVGGDGTVGWPAIILPRHLFWTPPHHWPRRWPSRTTTPTHTSRCCPWNAARPPSLARSSPTVGHGGDIARPCPGCRHGWIYLVTALLSGGVFITEGHRLLRLAKAGGASKVPADAALPFLDHPCDLALPRGCDRPDPAPRHRLTEPPFCAAVRRGACEARPSLASG